MRTKVELAPIQQAVTKALENGNSWSTICKNLGWLDKRGKPETSRLQRALGLRPMGTGGTRQYKDKNHVTKYIHTEFAHKLLKAIDRDPVDFEL